MAAALRYVRPQFEWYQLAYATEIKSIQLHDSVEGFSQTIISSSIVSSSIVSSRIVSSTLHYTLQESVGIEAEGLPI